MYNLFLSECRRYKIWAIIACVVQLLGWSMVAKVKPILAGYSEQAVLSMLLISLVSFAFGLVQMLLHKRKNNWTYLIHRPLNENQIHLALTLSGAALLFVSLVLPFLLIVIGLDIFTNQVVDTRYYIYCVYLFMASLIPYFIATFVALSRSWGAILSIGLIFFVWRFNPTNYLTDLLIALLTLVWVYCLSRWSFKANLSLLPKNKGKLFLINLAILPTSYFLLTMSQALYYHIPLTIAGEHPKSQVVSGSYTQYWRSDLSEKANFLLKASQHPDKNSIIRQAKLADEKHLPISLLRKAKKDQFYIQDASYGLSDPANNRQWVFSHDEMLFIGLDTYSDQITGYLGKNGFLMESGKITEADKFTYIPRIQHQRFLQTEDKIFELNFNEQQMYLKHQLPVGEIYASKVQQGRNAPFFSVSSYKSLYLFDAVDFLEENLEVTGSNVIEHPVKITARFQLEYQTLVDGYLFYYYDDDYFGENQPGGNLVKVNHDGTHQTIIEKSFTQKNHPVWIEYNSLLVSPILGILTDEYLFWLSPRGGTDYYGAPKSAWTMSAIITIICTFITLILSSHLKLSLSFKVFWVINSLLFSVPALISFILLNIWRNRNSLQTINNTSEKTEPLVIKGTV